MADERKDLDEQEYPEVGFHFDIDNLKRRAVDHVFGSLLGLDINKAENAIARGERSETTESDERKIAVTTRDDDQGGPMLQFTVQGSEWCDVHVDPAKFDRSNKTQDQIFVRCQRLVKALHDAQSSVVAGDDYEHPRLGVFQFWVLKEGENAARSAEEWAAVAEAWTLE
jgi:hypothetical protein